MDLVRRVLLAAGTVVVAGALTGGCSQKPTQVKVKPTSAEVYRDSMEDVDLLVPGFGKLIRLEEELKETKRYVNEYKEKVNNGIPELETYNLEDGVDIGKMCYPLADEDLFRPGGLMGKPTEKRLKTWDFRAAITAIERFKTKFIERYDTMPTRIVITKMEDVDHNYSPHRCFTIQGYAP